VRRRVSTLLGLVMTLLFVADATAVQPKSGFAFGRLGGNIRPYTVRIENNGVVKVQGAATIHRKLLSAAQIGRLNLKAVEVEFARMPDRRNCKQALPDVAYTFIRVGPRTVQVRGTCIPGYTQLWQALARAVKLSIAA
jgi:hypothetical protein